MQAESEEDVQIHLAEQDKKHSVILQDRRGVDHDTFFLRW
jgi:hypothetical protein